MWKKIKSKALLTHPRLKVVEDDVVLPNGSRIKYLRFAKSHDSVTVICQRDDKKVLLLSEFSYPPRKWLLQFPGGSIETKERPVEAANRELMEEAELYARRIRPLGKYYVNNRRSNAQMYVFFATNLEKRALKKDDEEEFSFEWHSVEEIDQLVKSNKVTNCHVLAPWLLFRSKVNGK